MRGFLLAGVVSALALMATTAAGAQQALTCPLPSGEAAPEEFAATIVGTEGRDVIRGTEGPDVIVGLGGNDRIEGLGGDDLICGGLGNDTVDGGEGDDFLLGDTGDTFRRGFPAGMDVPGGNDRLMGGSGDDGLAGEGGNDLLYGGDGNDFATGQMGQDGVFGEDGDDELFGGPDTDFVSGGAGDDFMVGNFGTDILLGGSGDDAMIGDAFFGDTSGLDICIGQEGFDLSAACEANISVEGDLPPEEEPAVRLEAPATRRRFQPAFRVAAGLTLRGVERSFAATHDLRCGDQLRHNE
jgi:hypothetical protein